MTLDSLEKKYISYFSAFRFNNFIPIAIFFYTLRFSEATWMSPDLRNRGSMSVHPLETCKGSTTVYAYILAIIFEHAWQTSTTSSITWIVNYWCPLRHCAYDLPHFLTPSPLFCMRKDALFWSNVCNVSRRTIFDAPHYLRKQRQEDCGIAESLTHTAIRQLIPSARQSSKNGWCKQSLGWQSAVCRRTNSARSQLWPVTTAGTRAKADIQTPSTLEQVSWNRNQDFFIHSRPEQGSWGSVSLRIS